jgi:KDO2-lipid IV(A) lauroyltransferase
MPEARAPSPLGLFGDRASRRAVIRYWLSDTVFGLINLVIHHALRFMPTPLCSAFGAVQARFCPARYPEADATARHVWQTLRPEASTPAEVDAAMARLWRCVARTMSEYSVLQRLYQEGRVEVEGFEHVQAVRAAGRPLVLAGLHLSCWEVIGAMVSAAGCPIAMTYEVPENRFDHLVVKQARARYGIRTVYPDHAGGRAAYRCVARDNRIFLFYIDEIFRSRVSAPEFGRGFKTEGNIGNAVRLARLTDAEIIVAYCIRLGDAPRFRLTFTPPLAQVRTENKEADLAANVAALDRIIAPVVQANLDQWYYALSLDFEPWRA